MDERALRLEQVRLEVRTNERLVDLQARRHVAAFAVGLTAGTGALAALVAGQLPALAAGGLIVGAGALVATQLRALGRLRPRLEAGERKANAAIETLMTPEVEPHVDGADEAQP